VIFLIFCFVELVLHSYPRQHIMEGSFLTLFSADEKSYYGKDLEYMAGVMDEIFQVISAQNAAPTRSELSVIAQSLIEPENDESTEVGPTPIVHVCIDRASHPTNLQAPLLAPLATLSQDAPASIAQFAVVVDTALPPHSMAECPAVLECRNEKPYEFTHTVEYRLCSIDIDGIAIDADGKFEATGDPAKVVYNRRKLDSKFGAEKHYPVYLIPAYAVPPPCRDRIGKHYATVVWIPPDYESGVVRTIGDFFEHNWCFTPIKEVDSRFYDTRHDYLTNSWWNMEILRFCMLRPKVPLSEGFLYIIAWEFVSNDIDAFPRVCSHSLYDMGQQAFRAFGDHSPVREYFRGTALAPNSWTPWYGPYPCNCGFSNHEKRSSKYY